MEDFVDVLSMSEIFKVEVAKMRERCLNEARELLFGSPVPAANNALSQLTEELKTTRSPQQTKKKIKHLSTVLEAVKEETDNKSRNGPSRSIANCGSLVADSNTETTTNAENTAATLMPPPPAPETTASTRPQRSTRVNVKSLKVPSLGAKVNRSSKTEEPLVKLEHEQRRSQFIHENSQIVQSTLQEAPSSVPLEEPTPPLPSTEYASVILSKTTSNEKGPDIKPLRILIKREKDSNEELQTTAAATKAVNEVQLPEPAVDNQTVVTDKTLLVSSNVAAGTEASANQITVAKKGRKKKNVPHQPIKVERFSDIGLNSPISSRTRSGNSDKRNLQEPQCFINKEAVGEVPVVLQPAAANNETVILSNVTVTLPNATMTLSNATMTLPNATMTLPNTTVTLPNVSEALAGGGDAAADATFKVHNLPNANATQTISKDEKLGDVTYEISHTFDNQKDSLSSDKTMETARGYSQEAEQLENASCMTEDDSYEQRQIAASKANMGGAKAKQPAVKAKPLPPVVGKDYKMPQRKHELFNPLMQSPVKMRVEAFEHAAQAAAAEPKRITRNKAAKENASGVITPSSLKLPVPTVGRFLTPTQSSNIAPFSSAQPKRAPQSASKATSLLKAATSTNLKQTNSASTRTLSRENSGEDFRKGLHQLAEERKKQREQKHLLAAQQREAKDRERVERMAKLAKEREEKRLRKVQEQERRKKEIEDINRKLLKQQEEAEAQKKNKIKAQHELEREMIAAQMKKQQLAKQKAMMPPPPKVQTKYTFEMLHEDDSTDDEGKVSYKRPPPPAWSRSNVRGASILLQQHCPMDVIDSFFSVAPTTPDLRHIFPDIDPRQLKRNSSVLWSTPPRYSELPKY